MDRIGPVLLLDNAPPSSEPPVLIVDTNLLNCAITSPGGAVIHRLNAELSKLRLPHSSSSGLRMTPFQLIEVLGTRLPDKGAKPRATRGEPARVIVTRVVDETLAAYLGLPELSVPALEVRARERRGHLPPEGVELFDICVLRPCLQRGLSEQIASALAWDHALKSVYPKSAALEVDRFLAVLMIISSAPHISRFRIAKRLWDRFYQARRSHAVDARPDIEAANRAMRLKTSRDFLDCDLLHLACFGDEERDVVVLTCDPPETILNRIAVYKGMVAAAASMASPPGTVPLPLVRAGTILRCEPTGEISHIFPVQRVPTIV